MKSLGKWLSGLAMALAATGASANFSDNEVRIGLITDLTSVYKDVGYYADVAAEMAVEDFGGKVLGKKVRFYVRDHKLNTELALKHAKELDEQYNVDAFLEMVGTNVAIPLQRYAKENEILALHTGTASSLLTGAECSPYGVHWTYDTYALAGGSAGALAKQGVKTWYFITVDYAFGKVLQAEAEAVIKASGGKVLGTSTHAFKATDFSSQLLEARRSGADVIALANAGHDTVLTVRQAYELGLLDGSQKIVSLLFTENLPQLVGMHASEGVTFASAYHWSRDDETRAWHERFYQRSGASSTMYSVGVYSAVLHYLKAIEAAGTDDPKAVIAKMRELPVNDVLARNGRVREDGRMVHDMLLLRVKSPTQVQTKHDYYEIVDVIPGDEAFRPLEAGGCPYIQN